MRNLHRLVLPVLLLLLSPLPSLAAGSDVNPDAAYRKDYAKWNAETVDDLKQNWLSLVGLFWLKPGANTFGAASAEQIVLPAGSAPPHAGTLELNGTDVTLKLAPETHAKIDGKPVTTAALQPDISGKPTVVELGSLRLKIIVRGDRVGLRVKDLNSRAARNFTGLNLYPLDLSYRVTAQWVPSDGKKTVDVPNVLGDLTPTPVPGHLKFTLRGQPLELTPLGGDAAKGFFIVFSDPTAKTDTYPGGRFLDTEKVEDGKVVLDFNRAYNPPCAVTPYATCPLAPKENRLSAPIPAGEKYNYKTTHH